MNPSQASASFDEAGAARPGTASARGDAAAWSAFASAQSVEDFCGSWLALQCARFAQVHAAVVLVEQGDGSYVPAAAWPDVHLDVSRLAGPAERALTQGRGLVERDEGGAGVSVAYPVEVSGHAHGVVVLWLASRSDDALADVLRQLHWGAGWLESMFRRLSQAQAQARSARVAAALEVVALAGEHWRLDSAALAVANDLVARLACERVSVGVLRRGQIRLRALSHSAHFERRSRLVAAIENAMEEALDQGASVVYPPGADGARISVAHGDLSEIGGSPNLASAVVRAGGTPIAVVTAERVANKPFGGEDVLLLEAVADLIGPLVGHKRDAERWLAGKAVDRVRDGWRALVGPRRAGLKFASLLVVAGLLFLAFADGQHRVTAKAVIEGAVQRVVAAPFDGFIREAPVRAGDIVRRGQVLAVLDDRDLRLERSRISSEREQSLRRFRDAVARHDRTAAGIVGAELAQTEAQLALVDEKLARTRLVASFDGVVVSGDLSQMLGSPIEQGKTLFEVAPLDAYRAILQVDERDMIHVANGQRGTLALAGRADERFAFTIRQVTPVSTPSEGENTFRVEAALDDASLQLRPGMEGVGKVEIGERRLMWIWTHRAIDWLRLTLWRWTP